MASLNINSQIICEELKSELIKIDSIVKSIDENEARYNEGIVEGPIEYKGLFSRNGGWDAYYLHENKQENNPIRIKYSAAFQKKYESYDYYYENGNLVFISLKVEYYKKRKSNKSFERQYYFRNGNLICDSNPEIKEYSVKEVLLQENIMRKICYD